MKWIYLDNGATTRAAPEVIRNMMDYFENDYGNPSSLHSMGQNAKEAIEKSRNIIARKINAKPEEIIFTSGGTESDNLALRGTAYYFGKGHIITSRVEHSAVLSTCRSLEDEGFEVTYLDVDENGLVTPRDIEEAIRWDTILVSIIHGNNEIGTIHDLEKIGRICKKNGVVFHSDAVQSFTKVPIDVKKLPVDMLAFSSHKIHGPKGVGALYIKSGTPIKPINTGGRHEMGLRAGTENVPGIAGFGKAVEISDSKQVDEMERLRDYLIDTVLEKFPDAWLNGHRKNRLPNNASFTFPGVNSGSLLTHLDLKGIMVSTGSACSRGEPSHVLRAIGISTDDANASLRITLSRYTTKEEVDYFISAIEELVPKLKRIHEG